MGSELRPEMGVRRGLGLIIRGCFFDRGEEDLVRPVLEVEALRLRPPVEVVVSSPDSLEASLNSDSSSSSSVIFEVRPRLTTFLVTLGAGGGRTVIDLREERRG